MTKSKVLTAVLAAVLAVAMMGGCIWVGVVLLSMDDRRICPPPTS